MKIATIYNEIEDVHMDVMWDQETCNITYRNADTGEEWNSGESANTLQEAIDDTYGRYSIGWNLEIEEF